MKQVAELSYRIRLGVQGDLEALTRLHCESFKPEEHVPRMLGRDYVRAMYRWLLTSSTTYVGVANDGTDIVGLIAVADTSFTAKMFMACLPQFVMSILRNPLLLLRPQLWNRLVRRENIPDLGQRIATYPGMAQMTIGAVDVRYRGTGVFPALVDFTKSECDRRGSRGIRAGVYRTNRSCRRVFEKSGWIETPPLGTPETVFYVAYLDASLPRELGLDFVE